jgi:hypothetical protein
MVNSGIRFGVFALTAGAALAQNQNLVYHDINGPTPPRLQEMVNIIRTAVDIRDVSADNTANNLTVSGSPQQLALADWLCRQLDQPAGQPIASTSQYDYTGDPYPAVRVFRLAHVSSPAMLQELVNVVRTAVDINRVFPFNALPAIAIRATPDQAALAEWLIHTLDIPAGPQPASASATPLTFTMNFSQPLRVDASSNKVQVFYLTHPGSLVSMQEIVNSLRTIAEISRVFPVNGPLAIVARGSADEIALAGWMIHELDQAGPSSQASEVAHNTPFSYAPQARIFHLAHLSTTADLQQAVNFLRGQTQINRAMACSLPRAIALRGSMDQIAQAEKLIANLDK